VKKDRALVIRCYYGKVARLISIYHNFTSLSFQSHDERSSCEWY